MAFVVKDRTRRAAKTSAPARNASLNDSRPDRSHHELLEVGGVRGVLAAVEDVEERDRQGPGADAAEISIQRQVVRGRRRVRTGERHAKDRVRPQLTLVRCPVEVVEERIHASLVAGVETQQLRRDPIRDVRHGRQDAPLPPKRPLSPSRSSTASWAPVEAPDGTAARPTEPSARTTSTSMVGLPRELRNSRGRR